MTSYASGFGKIFERIYCPNSNQELLLPKLGYLSESGARSSINRQVVLPVLNDMQCRKNFNVNSEYQFCAGNRLKEYNTCRGDSGNLINETKF